MKIFIRFFIVLDYSLLVRIIQLIYIIFLYHILTTQDMLGKNLNNNNNKALKKSAYDELDDKGMKWSKVDYQKIIDEKDQIIRKLEFKL